MHFNHANDLKTKYNKYYLHHFAQVIVGTIHFVMKNPRAS